MTQALTDLANQIGTVEGLPKAPRERGLGERLLNVLPLALSQFGSRSPGVQSALREIQITPEEEFEQEQKIAAFRQELLKSKFNALLGVERVKQSKTSAVAAQARSDRTFGRQLLKDAQDQINKELEQGQSNKRIEISERGLNLKEIAASNKVAKAERDLETATNKQLAREQVAQVRLEKGDIEGYFRALAGAPLAKVGDNKTNEITRKKKIDNFRDNNALIQRARTQAKWPDDMLDQMAESRFRIDEEADGILRDTSAQVWEAYWGVRIATNVDPQASVNVDGFTLKGRTLQLQFIENVKQRLSVFNLNNFDPTTKQALLESIANHTLKFNPEKVEALLLGQEETAGPLSSLLQREGGNIALRGLTSGPGQALGRGARGLVQLPGNISRGAETTFAVLLSQLLGDSPPTKEPQAGQDFFEGIK